MHFTERLREELQDPEFCKIEGFPFDEHEDILRLSNPPHSMTRSNHDRQRLRNSLNAPNAKNWYDLN